MPDILSSPLNPVEYEKVELIYDRAYVIFRVELCCKKPTLYGEPIFIDETPTYDGKVMGFWHIGSIRADEAKYDMYPCNNDPTFEKCSCLCELNHAENFLKEYDRIPCLYRVVKVKWVKEIIELANKNSHPDLRIWVSTNQRTKRSDLLIRFVNKSCDYVIIFEIVKGKKNANYYRLKTAFPVVLKSYKLRFDNEYRRYITANVAK